MYEDPKMIGSWISHMSNKVKTYGGINLAQGLPGFNPPRGLLDSLASEIESTHHQYAPTKGFPALLTKISDYMGLPSTAANENLLITCGATEAIHLIYQHLARKKKKFTVAAFGPSYESYVNLPSLLGHNFVALSWQADGSIDFDYLKTAIINQDIDLILIGSPGNPWGRVLTKYETEQFCKLTITTNAKIIFDMVYSELWFDQPAVYPQPVIQDKVYVVGSFSKFLSVTGWRIGWLTSTAAEMKEICLLHDFSGLSAPHPLQAAISNYLEDQQDVRVFVENLRKSIKNSYTLLAESVTKMGFHVIPAGGGYFVWANIPEGFSDSRQFVLDLYKKENLATVPGIHFGAQFNRMIRFNAARPIAEINAAVLCLSRFLNSQISSHSFPE